MKLPSILLLVLIAATAARADFTPTFDGAFGGAYAGNSEEEGALSRARMRFGAASGLAFGVKAEAAWEGNVFLADEEVLPLAANPRERLGDPPLELSRGRNYIFRENLDRLYLAWERSSWNLTLGRQAVGHGSGRFFNPGDIFAPQNPGRLWSEYKSGIDAARLYSTVGEKSGFGALLAAHREGGRRAYYLVQGRTNVFDAVDLSGYGGMTLGAPTAALDVAFDLYGAGLYADSVCRFDREFPKGFRSAVGVHGRVLPDLDAIAEYHFNGPGGAEKKSYPGTLFSEEAENGEIFVLGKNYAVLGLDWQAHPLVSAGMRALANLGDSSATTYFNISWSASDYVTVVLGGSAGRGPGGSEFSGAPDTVFAEARLNL